MKYLITTIAALVLVGWRPPPPDISIWAAASEGNIEAVKQHLAAGTDVNLRTVGIKDTPLHRAVEYGHKEVVELLINKGANLNIKDFTRNTPLDMAILYTRTETADLLRKHGAKTGEELKAEGK